MPKRFRPDIEGLRAVAIVAVLVAHAGVPFLAGGFIGVDVFFVISGFLITGLILREMEKTGALSLSRFYARRARRLLPLTAVVLLFVVVGSSVWLSPVQGVEVSKDIVSSAFFITNWHFAAQSVDYFSQDLAPSPVQHLWSLAIEEQFYLVWPSLLLGFTWFSRRRGWLSHRALWVLVLGVSGASFAYGVHITDTAPAAAYFSSFGRAWELGLGAALALLGARTLPRHGAAMLGWAGLAAIVYAAVVFDDGTRFPGYAALVPTLGAAALILAGTSEAARGWSASGLLSTPPFRWIGRISYSWYLWHWPMLVFAAAIWGELSPEAGLAVVGVSLVPTLISHYAIEEPFRHAKTFVVRPRRALILGATCTAVAVTAGLLLSSLQPVVKTAPASEVPGVAALPKEPKPQQRASELRPNPLTARDDRSEMYYDGCLVGITQTKPNLCAYGDKQADRTVILFGDSHAMQYFPALEPLAEKRGWRLITVTKAECTPAMTHIRNETFDREYSECDEWRNRALARMANSPNVNFVVTSGASEYTAVGDDGSDLNPAESAKALKAGYVDTLNTIRDSGMKVAVIKDLPEASEDIPSCVSEELKSLQDCAFRGVPAPTDDVDRLAATTVPDTPLLDPTDLICPDGLCRAVIGNALVYRDHTHLTATLARTLEPWMEDGLDSAGFLG